MQPLSSAYLDQIKILAWSQKRGAFAPLSDSVSDSLAIDFDIVLC